jgi:predicted ATPase/class 3 adenylate cyclase
MSALPDEAPVAIPSGTITFLFTDIEGSTQRWDRDRSAMELAVRRHDALMRDAIAAHNGHVFKTIGDAFCAAFARPEDAVAAMFDAQRALGAEDFSAVDGIRVRAAIHTGTADERDRDYFGPAVNRVARLLGIGHGGQVLVSGVTSDLVQGSLPPQASLRDLGEHRLRDLSRPEYVYQLLGPGIAAEFPPLRSLDLLPNNLPLQIKSFVGREAEVAELTALIAKHRLVTIVGSGGIGKTRTSLQVAANLLDGSGDGVWFIELAPLSSGDLIPGTVAETMGLTLPADGDPVELLVRTLAKKRALLVFDNCEHLVEASARVIAAIVRGCPQVVTLASSRQGLGIAGEATYRMPPLVTPREAEGASLRAADASRYAAIALFVERARAADHRFALTDENAPIVADICKRLDGIALAIELAAARVKILSPKQLRDKLDERFRVLTGGSRDVLPRQQTLRALIDWSHDLLDDRERMLFRRLGIFVDGFTLEGASAVASGEDLDEFDVFDLLASLVEKSLVLAEPSGDTLRYRLLESTRAYALEKLREAGERDLVAGRHLRFLRDWLTSVRERLEATARTEEMRSVFAAELEGLRFALDDALVRSDVVAACALLAAIERTWVTKGLEREAIARIEAYLDALPIDEVLLHAKLGAILAAFLHDRGKLGRALEVSTKACASARASGDGPTLASALRWCASANIGLHHFAEAESALSEAAAIPMLSARLRLGFAEVGVLLSFASGDLDAAARGYEEAIATHRALGNIGNVYVHTVALAEVEHHRGRTLRAIALAREVLPALRSGKEGALASSALGNLAGYLLASDDLAGAAAAAREAIVTLVNEPDHLLVTSALEHLALVDALHGDVARAAHLAAYTNAAYAKDGTTRVYIEQTTYDRLTALLDANLEPEERSRLAAQGAALTAEAAVALALEVDAKMAR